jgi:aryl-alcohol dehydrogenase-like predicted oxidoreductase
MKSRRLGKSAIVVSEICMGTMTFGNQADEASSLRILDRCFDAGITFYDTAEGYPVPPDIKYVGRTEEIVGKWLKTKNRDAIILATKVSGPSHGWFRSPLRSSHTTLDRHNITRAIEGSLAKLGTDYIDLYQTHWQDHDAPYDETLEVLDELVRAGKVRIIGSSNESAWGLMKSLTVAEALGTARYQTVQNNFSLNNRRFEDEMAEICRHENVSLIPYSPLAGGVLTGKYNGGKRPDKARFSTYLQLGGRQADMAARFLNAKTMASTERLGQIAQAAGISATTLAVAWSKQHDFVASTIVGATHEDQLADIFAAADLILTSDVMAAIDKVSQDFPYPMG